MKAKIISGPRDGDEVEIAGRCFECTFIVARKPLSPDDEFYIDEDGFSHFPASRVFRHYRHEYEKDSDGEWSARLSSWSDSIPGYETDIKWKWIEGCGPTTDKWLGKAVKKDD